MAVSTINMAPYFTGYPFQGKTFNNYADTWYYAQHENFVTIFPPMDILVSKLLIKILQYTIHNIQF